jgi:hypothetical protein
MILGCLDFIGKFLPVFKLRASDEEEILGIDDVEIGEFAVSLMCAIVKMLADSDDSMTTSSLLVMSRCPTMLMRACLLTLWNAMLLQWVPTRRTTARSIPRINWPSGHIAHDLLCYVLFRSIPLFLVVGGRVE